MWNKKGEESGFSWSTLILFISAVVALIAIVLLILKYGGKPLNSILEDIFR